MSLGQKKNCAYKKKIASYLGYCEFCNLEADRFFSSSSLGQLLVLLRHGNFGNICGQGY